MQLPSFTIALAVPLKRRDGNTERPSVVVPIMGDPSGKLVVLASHNELMLECTGFKKTNVTGIRKVFRKISKGVCHLGISPYFT